VAGFFIAAYKRKEAKKGEQEDKKRQSFPIVSVVPLYLVDN
jgi:hypothetical protein